MSNKSTVFVVQHAQLKVDGHWEKRDISDAERFGSLVELLPAGPMVRSTIHAAGTLRHKLRAFGDADYLLCMGDPALIGMACAIASQRNAGRYKLLVWDKEVRAYTPIQVDLNARVGAGVE